MVPFAMNSDATTALPDGKPFSQDQSKLILIRDQRVMLSFSVVSG